MTREWSWSLTLMTGRHKRNPEEFFVPRQDLRPVTLESLRVKVVMQLPERLTYATDCYWKQ